MTTLLYRDETHKILGACHEVYAVMGAGYLEGVYQECLQLKFTERQIPAIAQGEIPLHYKGQQLAQKYRPDFLCFGRIIVEIKATNELSGDHTAQVINYLRGTGMRIGLLINFGHHPGLQFKRIIL